MDKQEIVKRSTPVHIRFTRSDRDIFDALSKHFGLTVSAVVRHLGWEKYKSLAEGGKLKDGPAPLDIDKDNA